MRGGLEGQRRHVEDREVEAAEGTEGRKALGPRGAIDLDSGLCRLLGRPGGRGRQNPAPLEVHLKTIS